MYTVHCPGVATCDATVGVCQCLHELVFADNVFTCTKTCNVDNDCILFNPASVCISNSCVDSPDPINIIPPVTVAPLSDSCSSDSDCHGLYSCDAISSTCTCSVGTVDCTQTCSEDSDCPTDMVCNDSNCVLQIISSGLCVTDSDF